MWKAWTPAEAADRLAGIDVAWSVVGGWAVDLFLGEQTRPHGDLEIAVPRGDFPPIRDALAGLAVHTVRRGELHRLPDRATPPPDTHQNWVLDEGAGAWRIDVMLEPGDATTWVFRRDETVRAPRSFMVGETGDAIPFLRPQGALLFKAKTRSAKDEADFVRCVGRMDGEARSWLRDALDRVHPGHPWTDQL